MKQNAIVPISPARARASDAEGQAELSLGSPEKHTRTRGGSKYAKLGDEAAIGNTPADDSGDAGSSSREAGAEGSINNPTAVGAAASGTEGAQGNGDGAGDDWIGDTLLEAVPALTVSLGGLLLAGYALDKVQSWTVFKQAHNLFVLVPVLLGLKGNLDMTLASRLSTAAHAGELGARGSWADARPALVSSLALVQVQAVVVALISALITCVAGRAELDVRRAVLIVGAAVTTMVVSAFVLGVFTCALVVLSHWHDFDPDNIATPIVASLGDLFTLVCLAGVATALWFSEGGEVADQAGASGASAGTGGTLLVSGALLALALLLLLPCMLRIALREDSCRAVLVHGWTPILAAMVISLAAGGFLDKGVQKFAGLAALVPVLSGSGGNLGCVYAARLCSAVNLGGTGNIAPLERRRAGLLLALAPLFSLLFLGIVRATNMGHVDTDVSLVAGYTLASVVQVLTLLLFVHWSVPAFWRWGLNPDNYATPLLTALGDVLGSSLILAAFHVLYGDTNK
eukprot:g2667.t1